MIANNSFFRELSIFLSAFYFLNYGSYLYSYYKRKKLYFNKVNEEISGGKKHNKNNIIEFNDDNFRFCDYKLDIRIKWFSFKGYRKVNDILFLDQTEEKEFAIMISKEEVGGEDFERILALVKEKIVTT